MELYALIFQIVECIGIFFVNIFNGSRDFFSMRPDKFSCQREQDQTCLSYAECSRKSHVCKMYEIVNKQVKILTAQYIGTCKSAYTNGYALI